MMDLTQRYPEGFYSPCDEPKTTGKTLWYGLNHYKDEWEADPMPFNLKVIDDSRDADRVIYSGYNFDEAIAATKDFWRREMLTYYWHDMDIRLVLV